MRCVWDVAPIRAEPDDGAEQVTQAVAREPLEVHEQRDGWARVTTAYDYPGWIRADALEEGDGELPPARDGDVVEVARSFLGAPYLWGGMTECGIDCSGLVHMSFRRLGVLVPRDAAQQEDTGRPVTESELQRGDLITYGSGDHATHIAFWLGPGRILHSSQSRNGVVEEDEPHDLRADRRRLVRLP